MHAWTASTSRPNTPEEAGEFCGVLRPAVAVPIHYAFTGVPVADRLFLTIAPVTPSSGA
jgi:L-ascorbate metabolism protein UlaG (beta-lactamase superfamily)